MVLAKAKENPLTELPLRKGVSLFSAYGLPKPLPLGEVSAQQTERASPARKSIYTAISIGF